MKKLHHIILSALLTMLSVQLNAQQFFFSAERPASCSATDGIVTIVPTRGVPPFTYLWNTGSTDLSLKNVPKGVYTATLTDATGASIIHTHILNSEEFDLYQSDYLPSGWCNPASGKVTVDPLGGAAPFTYLWSNGQTGATASGLTTGIYSVTVTDASGCVALGEYEVNPPPYTYYPNAGIVTVDEPDCVQTTNGELQGLMKYSYYPPYTYAWSNGATSQTVSNLSEGTYTVTVTDALGCSSASTILLQKKLTTTGSVVCSGTNVGTASALLAAATAPVTYTWNNGQSGPNLSGLSNGTYAVTATDANGCVSSAFANVAVPTLVMYDNSSKCYAGNNGTGYCEVHNASATSYLWDNGVTTYNNTTLSPGLHSITVTTASGCTISADLDIAAPVAPPIAINYTVDPADCTNGAGGAINATLSGGLAPVYFYAFGPNGFFTNSITSLQNIKGGDYSLTAYNNFYGCYTYTTVSVPDVSGFSPSLVVQDLDCTTGYGSAAILNVTSPGAQYHWSTGANTPAVFNLTQGTYSVTVTGGASCVQYYNISLYVNDSIQVGNNCAGLVSGTLINDLGVTGCTGVTGIPFQMIRTMPSGALNFTDQNGAYTLALPNGTFGLEPANYDPADIACPPGGAYTLTTAVGTTISGQDFHFYNANAVDHRVKHRALRTAQPGYPYSLRFDVCNDGNTANTGTMDLEYGNFLSGISAASFPQHAGAFSFSSETAGAPDNTANFSFPGITPGSCELLQVDFTVPNSTVLNTQFITQATVSPSSGDPTPDNNVSTLYSTVVGSFDPNSVLSFPARNGNPHDGGDIWRNIDQKITYQITFQNTGNAPANQVIVRDTLDQSLDVNTIKNITASHDMLVSLEDNNSVLVFKFPNINLPDSTSDYANSIGSIQYDIDLAPGIVVGTKIEKSVAIFFDFNPPVITNNNVLEVINTTGIKPSTGAENSITTFPNPAEQYFGFYIDTTAEMRIFNSLGQLVAQRDIKEGLQQVSTADLPNGVYFLRIDTGSKKRSGKVVVSH